MIEAGWSLDDVKALLGEDGYAALSDEAKRIIGATSDVMTRINKETAGKEAKDALLDYYDLAATGVDIATIEAIAKNYGHYAELKDNGWDLVTKTAETMSDKQTASLVIGMLDMPTAQDARDYLAYQGVSADKVDEIMAAWEERNTNDLLAGIKNGTVKKIDNYSGGGYAGLIVNGVEIRLRDLVNDIKQSIYGKGVSDILSAVADAYIAYAQSSSSVTRSQLALNMLNEFRLELSRNEIDASIIEEAYRQIERLPQYQNAISR